MTTYLTNARVHTLDARTPFADTIAIRAGRISAIGRAADILPSTEKAEIEDLGGKTVIPGLCDAHIHLLEYGLSLARVDCETPTRGKCLERLRHCAESARPGQWVTGHGWNHNVWPEGAGSKDNLDEIFPHNTVYLTHKSLHSAWVNSAALQAAGINTQTPDPPDGRIERDARGEPTGILFESAMRLVDTILPVPSAEERKNALLTSQRSLLEMGITRAHDFDAWECYQTLVELDEAGLLKLRVVKNIPANRLDEAIADGLHSGSGSPFLKIGWLKLFADGALGPQTAAMLEPFERSDSLGMLFLESQQIVETGKKALAAGISPAIHAIGDRANREVLDGYEALAVKGYLNETHLRPRIEHVQLITPADMARLAALGVIASMQPIHAVSDMRMADRHWGARCIYAYAWRSLMRAGARVIFGSDAPVESPDPFLGLHAAVTRQPADGEAGILPWYPQEQLTLDEALPAYTTRLTDLGANSSEPSCLTPGAWADMCILPCDIFSEEPDALVNMRPEAVMVSGEWMYWP
jgi:hypothetical protein